MKSANVRATWLATFIIGFFLTASLSEAKTKQVTCTATRGINIFLTKAKPGDVFVVSGTCNENVLVPSHIADITIDGQGLTTINPPDPTAPAVAVQGANEITIKNLVITGGSNGIQVRRGGTAVIDGVTVSGAASNGIAVNAGSFARIINSTIQNNGSNGVVITENSSSRLGFLANDDTVASPNTITGNANRGVTVSESSSAVIIGNNISNNADDGILVNALSHADIASNTINNNGDNGINVGRNSGVDLGADTGTGIFESPNSTTVNNANFGLRCFINSYADGRLGTLNGAAGQIDFSGGCINATIP
jgi:Right handed beta helix region